MCADIMQAGFRYPEKRYEHQVGRVIMQDTQDDSRNESDISVGPVIERLDSGRGRSIESGRRHTRSESK